MENKHDLDNADDLSSLADILDSAGEGWAREAAELGGLDSEAKGGTPFHWEEKHRFAAQIMMEAAEKIRNL
jgi:hypothetical protein